MIKNKRNYAIDFLRLVFIIIVCIHHFQPSNSIMIIKSGFIVVEFFFILSGFLLYYNYDKYKELSLSKFIIRRLKTLFVDYLIAMVICFVLSVLTYKDQSVVDFIFKSIPEFFLLQNVGFFYGGINYPLWYISVMLVSEILIFIMLQENERKTIKLVLPICILLFYTLIYSNNNSLENFNRDGAFYLPLLRGFAGISVGVLACKFHSSQVFDAIKKHKVICRICELLLYSATFYLIIFKTNYEFDAVLLFSLIILNAMNENSYTYKLFNRNLFKKLGQMSYIIYLNHASFIVAYSYINRHFINNSYITLACYIISLLIFAILYGIIRRLIHKKMQVKQEC